MSSATFRDKNRKTAIPLVDLLPLTVPLSVLIDPTNHCNFKCHFCPTGDKELLEKVGRPIGLMDYNLEPIAKLLALLRHA